MRAVAFAAFVLLATSPALAAVDARCTALIGAFAKGASYNVTSSGLRYRILKLGGKRLVAGNVALGNYALCFQNGTFVEASEKGKPGDFTVGAKQVIRGVEEAYGLIGVGGEMQVFVPYHLAYGEKARSGVPARSNLLFDLTLVDIQNVALSTLLERAYNAGGIPAMKSAYARYAATGFTSMYSSQSDLDNLGYRFLVKKHLPNAAVAVLEFNTARYPNSWNAYDSLGDAYREAGNRSRAIATYRRALQLNPKDKNAESNLQKLMVK